MDIKGLVINDLLKNQHLSFKKDKVDSNGEFKDEIAEYKSLQYIVKIGTYVNLNGSLHKYFNDGKHNHNDFKLLNLVEVLNDLSSKFILNPFLVDLHNLEFGVNVILPFDTDMFLNSILSYKGKEYEKKTYNGKGYLLRFSFDHYDLKIYNKGLQFDLEHNVLRFEIKVKRMVYFKNAGIEISRLSDLLNPNNFEKLKNRLLKSFKELVIYDATIELDRLTKRERAFLVDARNPKYWIAEKKRNKENFKKKRKRFRQMVSKYGVQKLQEIVLALIESKWCELTNLDTSTKHKMNEYLSQFSNKTFPELTTLKKSNKINIPQINSLHEGLNWGIIKRQ